VTGRAGGVRSVRAWERGAGEAEEEEENEEDEQNITVTGTKD
jgi:hypothetical protein